MLPIGPTGDDHSPYRSPSAFAGNPLLVSPDRLVEQGLLSRNEVGEPASGMAGKVDFVAAGRWKTALLRRAFAHFKEQVNASSHKDLDAFSQAESYWLEDFSLFSAIQGHAGTADWTRWQPELRTRQPDAMRRATERCADDIRYHAFIQWQFSVQWNSLRAYCLAKDIRLIGDVPLFVAHQSADVWAHPELFKLDAAGHPTVVAGVPPDYFSPTGQLWGLPVYRWETMQAQGYRWWMERLRMACGRFDINRLDHFIGFVRTYEVSAQETTALNGTYRPGGGTGFLNAIRERLGPLQFIADDLGDSTPEVVAVLERYHIPGTRVLQFDLGSLLGNDARPPASHPQDTVVYTGSHDNDTTAGWLGSLNPAQHQALADRLKAGDRDMVWAMIRAALASPSTTAIVTMQDLLELGSEARMNFPGIATGYWGWRLQQGVLTESLAERLRSLVMDCGRLTDFNPLPPAHISDQDLTPRIATRAYALFERRGRHSGHGDQDWLQAEREVRREAIRWQRP